MTKSKLIIISVIFASGLVVVGMQNCSKVNFSSTPPPYTTATTATVKSLQPALAVRGINCMACHGYVNSNVVTDYGYGSPNFGAGLGSNAGSFFNGNRTAYADSATGGGNNGWQSWDGSEWTNFQINGGSLIVPAVTIAAQQAMPLFGLNADTSFKSLLNTPNLINPGSSITVAAPAMAAGITPVAGQDPIQEYSQVQISYPSQAEILALVPNAANVSVTPIQVQNLPMGTISGLSPDATGSFATNIATVSCFGDVVIKGVLFLNNATIQTDSNGCRLYVSQSVFIQGPINGIGESNGSNLQIASSSAIIMGMSAQRLGAPPTGTSTGIDSTKSTVRVAYSGSPALTTSGGPWQRFAVDQDVQFNPGLSPINGVAPSQFFDSVVNDALTIGSQLQDAGDAVAIQAATSISGETVVTEAANSANGNDGGGRLSINYSGLLLNAPHIHSRYFGNLSGVIIADVAFLARNPSASQNLEKFIYDHVFDNVTAILPALKTEPLVATK